MKFEDMKGIELESIEGLEKDSDEIVFSSTDGRKFKLYHYQDCCEQVSIVDVNGDPNDLIGRPLLIAEERVGDRDSMEQPSEYAESWTWTFYAS